MLEIQNESIKRLYENKITRKYSMLLEKDIENKRVSILSDKMFKFMFVHENKLKYSCKLLSYYLDISCGELLKVLKLEKNDLIKNTKMIKAKEPTILLLFKILLLILKSIVMIVWKH